MLALVALALFALAAFGVRFDEVDIVALGLAFVAGHLLLGTWPLGRLISRRDN